MKYAGERGSSARIYQQAQRFEESAGAYPGLQKTILTPVLSTREKEDILRTAAGAGSDSDFLSFVRLVIRNRREAYFRSICLMYQKLYREQNDIVQVRIVTATPLDDAVLDQIKQLIERKSGQQVEFIHEVDASLIGGFVLRCESTQLDASVSNELKLLRLKLLK